MGFQEMMNDQGIYYTFFFYLFKVLTWGYIPHILFGLGLSILFMFLIILIKERQKPFYVFKEKYRYTRYFLYLFTMEKINFMKFTILEIKFYIQSREGFRFWVTVIIICIVFVIIFLFSWDSIQEILKNKAEQKINESINNISINNTKSI